MEYIVTEVHSQVKDWNWNGKSYKDYAIRVDGVDGWLKVTYFADKPAPSRGDKLSGEIKPWEDRKSGEKFRKLFVDRPTGNRSGFGSSAALLQSVQNIENLVKEMRDHLISNKSDAGKTSDMSPDAPFDDSDFPKEEDGKDPFKEV